MIDMFIGVLIIAAILHFTKTTAGKQKKQKQKQKQLELIKAWIIIYATPLIIVV
ncbi:MAG: hypothetical protein J6580_00100 [Gilliamella sp.]|uniref:hypothetical protein n=1 Tax=Gilliamella sp. TaxID=1891236 RepID=UPI0025EEA393|nr:hypothetical protein [Gilliamella sp.]MCO6549062.1 hypothetical protein [Gilliamella sp.]